jgi:hypothetical protein
MLQGSACDVESAQEVRVVLESGAEDDGEACVSPLCNNVRPVPQEHEGSNGKWRWIGCGGKWWMKRDKGRTVADDFTAYENERKDDM